MWSLADASGSVLRAGMPAARPAPLRMAGVGAPGGRAFPRAAERPHPAEGVGFWCGGLFLHCLFVVGDVFLGEGEFDFVRQQRDMRGADPLDQVHHHQILRRHLKVIRQIHHCIPNPMPSPFLHFFFDIPINQWQISRKEKSGKHLEFT